MNLTTALITIACSSVTATIISLFFQNKHYKGNLIEKWISDLRNELSHFLGHVEEYRLLGNMTPLSSEVRHQIHARKQKINLLLNDKDDQKEIASIVEDLIQEVDSGALFADVSETENRLMEKSRLLLRNEWHKRGKLDLEKGLYRIYIITSLCGIACLGCAIYNHQSYKDYKTHYNELLTNPNGRLQTLQNRKKTLWDAFETRQKENQIYANEPTGNHEIWLAEIKRRENDMEAWKQSIKQVSQQLSSEISEAYLLLDRLVGDKKNNAKDTAMIYTYFFLCLSLLPWVIHYIVKFIFLPLTRWVINGFKG